MSCLFPNKMENFGASITGYCNSYIYIFFFLHFLQAAEGARLAGASRIIGVDLNSKRFIEGERSSIRSPVI